MFSETDLARLLAGMSPQLLTSEYVFCHLENGHYGDYKELNPIASFQESEGLTLIVDANVAVAEAMRFDGRFRCITLLVHSSLNATGLTAAVSSVLAENNISANVLAAFYHDHIFVPAKQAEQALQLLEELAQKNTVP